MGVQSTIQISREEAERKFVDKKLESLRRAFELEAGFYSNQDLEDAIEEEFHNYFITFKEQI